MTFPDQLIDSIIHSVNIIDFFLFFSSTIQTNPYIYKYKYYSANDFATVILKEHFVNYG